MPDREPDANLDCRGLLCPQPVIRTAARVREMEAGQVLEVVGTDPGLGIDIPAYCLSHGHTLLGVEQREGVIACRIEVGGPSVPEHA